MSTTVELARPPLSATALPNPTRGRAALLLALLLAVSGTLMIGAMRRTSLTFDESVMIAAGVRGYETGRWDLAPEHPPVVQYLYGLPAWLAGPRVPSEQGVTPDVRARMFFRYMYARQFFWGEGNDALRLTFLGRLPAVLCALLLVLTAYLFVAPRYGTGAGLLAAALVAFLPDVLAHAGVAYNDLPLALAYLAAALALDRAIRSPSLLRAVAAGLLCALALGIKNSAVALAPVAVVLLVAEAATRGRDPGWWRRVAVAAVSTLAATYLGLVAIYRGDFALAEYRYALDFVFGQVTRTPSVAYLFGERIFGGAWYWFPVAFFFKTSAALHVLVLAAALVLARAAHQAPRALLRSPLRAPAAALLVFAALLLLSKQAIGFRYALPALPPLCLLTAVGVVRTWPEASTWLRRVLAVAALWLVLHPLTFYPWFLSYISEYGPGRDRNYQVLVDSSLDWGQGLRALREWMAQQGVERVYLSYFGSALPAGYGIEYVALPSFFQLPRQPLPPGAAAPEWVAISATSLSGTYLGPDPFARFRELEPYAIVGGSIYLYPVQGTR